MTRFEPGIVRGGRAVRGDRTQPTVYSHRSAGRSIDDVRGRGREAQAATRGANALALSPAVEPVRRQDRVPARDAPPARRAQTARPQAGGPDAAAPATATPPATATAQPKTTTYERIRTAGASGARAAAAPRTAADDRRAAISVVPPLPVSTPRAPFVTLVLFVVVIGVMGILVINTKINENAFRLHDMRAQQGSLDQHEQQLQREIAEKESPGNLAAMAKQWGLVPADSPVFLRLPDGRSLGVPRPATGPASVSGEAGLTPAGAAGRASNNGQPGG